MTGSAWKPNPSSILQQNYAPQPQAQQIDYNGSNRYHLRNHSSGPPTQQQVTLNKPRQLANALDFSNITVDMDVDEEVVTTPKSAKLELH